MPNPISESQVDLVAGFLAPWEKDRFEVDGSRTYAVYDHRKSLFLQEVSAADIDCASTIAYGIIHDLIDGAFTNND